MKYDLKKGVWLLSFELMHKIYLHLDSVAPGAMVVSKYGKEAEIGFMVCSEEIQHSLVKYFANVEALLERSAIEIEKEKK